jgi:hypothetical protein
VYTWRAHGAGRHSGTGILLCPELVIVMTLQNSSCLFSFAVTWTNVAGISDWLFALRM